MLWFRATCLEAQLNGPPRARWWVLCVRASACCVRASACAWLVPPRAVLCECGEANGSNGLGEKRLKFWPAVFNDLTVSLNIFPLPLRPHLSAPAGSFSCFYLFWLHFIYLIGVPALLSCVLSHVGFSEQPSLIVRLSKTGQSPLWCPNFIDLASSHCLKITGPT